MLALHGGNDPAVATGDGCRPLLKSPIRPTLRKRLGDRRTARTSRWRWASTAGRGIAAASLSLSLSAASATTLSAA
eukprot:4027923-Lingulodinium_polyedra.AAC.2